VRIDLKRFKNANFDISNKERSGHPAAIEEDGRMNCRKIGKSCIKQWKIFRLIYIVLIDFLLISNKKNCKKSARTLAPNNL